MKRSRNSHRRTGGWGWIVVGVAGFAILAGIAFSGRQPTEYRHPHPRPDVTADSVMPDFLLGGFREAKPAYAVARAIPTVMDGLHCYCNCDASIGHRSLLSCFENMHGAACDVCQREAVMAAEGFARGEPIETIRATIDAAYGGG